MKGNRSGTLFILGKHVDEFELGFAGLQASKYCIGVSSGTDALHIALQALGIGRGDGVIVPVNTFIATAVRRQESETKSWMKYTLKMPKKSTFGAIP